MKKYFLPFLHPDKRITRYLLKSYTYLLFGKLCFFGGPLFLKHGINALQGAETIGIGDPLLMFLGYGVCYSASVLFQSMRNLESVKIVNIALMDTASIAYRHMLSLGPDFFFSGSQRHKLFNLFKVLFYLRIGTTSNRTEPKIIYTIFHANRSGHFIEFCHAILLFRFTLCFVFFGLLWALLRFYNKIL